MGDAGTSRTSQRLSRRTPGLPPLTPRKSSPTPRPVHSPFRFADLLPHVPHPPPHPSKSTATRKAQQITPRMPIVEDRNPVFGARTVSPMSVGGSIARSLSPPSVFDPAEDQHELFTEPTTALGSGSDEPSYDLKPPAPSVSQDNIETLSVRFFSADHLDVILRDHNLAARFTRFLNQYRPQHAQALACYLETKKAIAAVEYANAIAEQIPTAPGHPPYVAATLDDRFEARSSEIVEDLVDDALPAYITHRLVTLVTDTLVKEITGNNAPIMRELIPSLAEVYCVTDPSLPDNPIVYASEEFYNTTQYGREYTIGRNCRFLQGPRTSNSTVQRLIKALAAGQEICETILNYRRDGSPFMNLLMTAPLYDNKGAVRYFLGCQIDVSSLVEHGRGLESFSHLLAQDRSESRFGGRQKDAKRALGELGQMLSEEESNMMRSGSRRVSEDTGATVVSHRPARGGRRILGMDDTASERALWPHPSLGPSGRLPGVYQNYLLVRPYPSLRITFTSPALRIPGLLQTKFLDRIGGPHHVREGILDALAHGTGVTAKITWLTQSTVPGDRESSSLQGKPRWIHCTPLLGSDERVGVWMIVMVEGEEVTGQLNRQQQGAESGLGSPVGAASSRFTGSKLYAEYLRREGKPAEEISNHGGSQRSRRDQESVRERRDVDDQFRDF